MVVKIPAPTDAATSCSAPIRSFKRNSTHKAMVEISTTSVTDPNAVKSTVTTVSQGVRAFATPIRIVRSTLDTSCSSSSEVILIKRPRASEAVPNHQEAFMARAENLAGLGCMPYLPHTASTSTAEKHRTASPYSDERPGGAG